MQRIENINITDELYDKIKNMKYEQHMSDREIGEKLNIKTKDIHKFVRNNSDIKYKERDYEFMIESFVINKLSMTKIAKICNCSRSAVKRNLIEMGLREDDRRIFTCSYCNTKTVKGGMYKNFEYCKKHLNHMYRHGEILERTIYDENEFMEMNNCYKVILYDKNGDKVGESIFSKEDYNLISKYKWYLSHGYARTKGISSRGHRMHELLINNVPENHFVDHIDRNKLNNTRGNLRIVTQQQNAMNMSMKSTNTSGVTGVQLYKGGTEEKWDASITYNYESIWLHRDFSFDRCVKARMKAEAKYFGKYSANYKKNLNILSLQYTSHDDNKETILKVDLDGNIIEFKKN